MTPGGWIIMLVSVGAVVSLFIWCMTKVIMGPRQQAGHLHGFGEETPDQDEDNDR